MKNIGIDIDGVIGDIVPCVIMYMKIKYRIKLKRSDFVKYHISDFAGISKEEEQEMFLNESLYENEKLIRLSGCGILTLKMRGFNIHIITSRHESLEKVTKSWLKKHWIRFDTLDFVEAGEKQDLVKLYGIEYFIEDRLDTAIEMSSICKRSFLMDAPYNKGNFENITRVKRWNDIVNPRMYL